MRKRGLIRVNSLYRARTIRLLIIAFLAIAVFSSGCSGKIETPREDIIPGVMLRPGLATVGDEMKLHSNAFKDHGTMPVKYARQTIAGGRNISVPLSWEEVPEGTESFALVMVDISARNWVHWIVINIPAETRSIEEGASGLRMPVGSRELLNTFGTPNYGGPQPPQGTGIHSYVTTLYALSVEELPLPESTSYSGFIKAIEGKILAKASLSGGFSQ